MSFTEKGEVLYARKFGKTLVEVVIGNLADQFGIDAVVNPTTSSMKLMGGVGVALAAKADRQALAVACASLAPLEKTCAVATAGFGLPSPNIVHCLGPRYGEQDAMDNLGLTYWNIFSLAERNGFSSLAVSAVSAGAMGFPLKVSANIAIESVKDFSPNFHSLRKIRFVLLDEVAARFYVKELERLPQFSEKGVRLEMGAVYLPDEFDVMRQGFIGNQDMKWFFYFEEPWLYIYRGSRRYGRCYFWLRLPEVSGPSCILEAWADEAILSGDEFGGTEEAAVLVMDLLDGQFGLMSLSAKKESLGSTQFWLKRGKVALECSPDSERKLLSAMQAKELGRRLIELAEILEGRGSTKY